MRLFPAAHTTPELRQNAIRYSQMAAGAETAETRRRAALPELTKRGPGVFTDAAPAPVRREARIAREAGQGLRQAEYFVCPLLPSAMLQSDVCGGSAGMRDARRRHNKRCPGERTDQGNAPKEFGVLARHDQGIESPRSKKRIPAYPA